MSNPGKRNKKIVIQTLTEASDSQGGITETWLTLYTLWAAIWPLRSKEVLNQKQLEEKITHRMNIIYKSGITTKNRVLYDSRYFDIRSVINPDERNRELDLLCEETA